jgi:hypothetical protein
VKNLIFSDLYSLISAITEITSSKNAVASKTLSQVPWNIQGGLFYNISVVRTYHDRQFSSVSRFNDIAANIADVLAKLPENVIRQPIIEAEPYRETLLALIDSVELFQKQIFQYYSSNSLFQFSNITFQGDILFNSIQDVFDSRVWQFIPETARADIEEGGKALLFNLPTSASFMFLRAIEDCLRKLCGALDPNSSGKMFGEALLFLESHKAKINMPDKDFDRQVKLLAYIKDEFRNPSAHPDKHFSQREAEQLFQFVNVAIDKLSAMFGSVTSHGTTVVTT